MSNRSRGVSGGSTPGGQAFGEMLRKAAARAREKQESEIAEESGIPNELPKPKTQTIFDDRFEWEWNPLPDFHVMSMFDRELQSWMVDFKMPETLMTMSLDQAKAVGEALLAAYAWQHIWKLHVADYMLGDKTLKVVGDVMDSVAYKEESMKDENDNEVF